MDLSTRSGQIEHSRALLAEFVDALRVYEVQHGRLDESYLDRWATTLGLTDAIARLRAEAHPIE